MNRAMINVGIKEFREHLPQYLLNASPITITRHGEIIGLYIPIRPESEKAKWESLKEASLRLQVLLANSKVSEEEILQEFKSLRNKKYVE